MSLVAQPLELGGVAVLDLGLDGRDRAFEEDDGCLVVSELRVRVRAKAAQLTQPTSDGLAALGAGLRE